MAQKTRRASKKTLGKKPAAKASRSSARPKPKKKSARRVPLSLVEDADFGDSNLANGNGNGRPGRPRLKRRKTAAEKREDKARELARIKRWMKKNLPPPDTPEWEALCTQCGVCCYDKVWIGSRLFLLKSACQFLNTETNTCTCYENRFENEPLCMPIGAEIIQMGGLPGDCPYIQGLPGYKPPKVLDKTLDEV